MTQSLDRAIPATGPSTLPSWIGTRGVLALAGLALGGAGLTLGWDWLTAIGVAPLIVAAAPCLIMCALGLCMMGKGSKAASEQPAARLDEPGTGSLSRSET